MGASLETDERRLHLAAPDLPVPEEDGAADHLPGLAVPGRPGCTPQSRAYRDSVAELEALGAGVIGVSTQTAAEQAEFAAREHIPSPC